MATHRPNSNETVLGRKQKETQESNEDYIDMEVSSSSNFFCYSINSPPHPREFEFQMSSSSLEREPTTSPADELFYKGKLLPLYLPPRFQMVEKLLENSNTTYENKTEAFEEHCSTPFITTTPSTTTSTPFRSCNISPSESCRVSRELDPGEYFFECSTEASSFLEEQPKKSWSKKLKLIKQSSLGLKLKASRAYLRSLFSKSGCSDESCAQATRNIDEGTVSKAKECLNKYMKVAKKHPFGQIQKDRHQISATVMKEEKIEDGGGGHRRSFSGAIKRHSATSSSSSSSGSSSSSFSSNSNGFHELQFLKRSTSANSEIESSIQGAIAHCKQSQQLFHSRKTVSEVGFCTLSASRIAVCEDQERPGLCRG
ncbi:hypothetical protein HHK36_010907 [Tetracentron sinense]|uniref:Membrane-associated kinase regulator 4 n=1 Tax=Tetracentron sinense TaxID=13715 RepID=A0A834ZF74_TETSI|nr:hypothetical protein HHK36_010907 [Tetracentron sinense]